MKWLIPAKTFLLGEYIAMEGGPAIVLTTTPCFEVSRISSHEPCPFHPESPAGLFWNQQEALSAYTLKWLDPYEGLGGLGASSAQFLGAYWAASNLTYDDGQTQTMLQAYLSVAWSGVGMRPSGYDVLAQASEQCVMIHQELNVYDSCPWPFPELAFVLVHTGQKLATHEHLKQLVFDKTQRETLTKLVLLAYQAFYLSDGVLLIEAIKGYHRALAKMNLVAEHTMQQIEKLNTLVYPLAIKGCGALGADVILMLVEIPRLSAVVEQLNGIGYKVLATSEQLFRKKS